MLCGWLAGLLAGPHLEDDGVAVCLQLRLGSHAQTCHSHAEREEGVLGQLLLEGGVVIEGELVAAAGVEVVGIDMEQEGAGWVLPERGRGGSEEDKGVPCWGRVRPAFTQSRRRNF